MLDPNVEPIRVNVQVPSLKSGAYRITAWHTQHGLIEQSDATHFSDGSLNIVTPSFTGDIALAITRRG
jgi:hypothetical protein